MGLGQSALLIDLVSYFSQNVCQTKQELRRSLNTEAMSFIPMKNDEGDTFRARFFSGKSTNMIVLTRTI